MSYYVELKYDIPDISLGRLYAISALYEIRNDVNDRRRLNGWEDETGYVVEL